MAKKKTTNKKQTNKKKTNKKQSKKAMQRKVLTFTAAFICLYFVYSIVSIQIDIYRERQVLLALQQKIEEQRIENEELARILANGGEAEYIERIAREKLGYAAPDEQVFVDPSS